MFGRSLIAVALGGALLLTPAAAAANDSAMGGAGGAVSPIGSSTIRMAAETVQVIVYQQFAEYRVDFEFDNSGPPQKVKLGFPFPMPFEDTGYSPATAFHAWQDEKPLAVTFQSVKNKDGSQLGYYLHDADFPAGKSMIRVSYYAYHDSTAGSPPDGAVAPERFKSAASYWGFYPYTVSTGAGWAGTIGTSVVRYYLSDDSMAWGIDAAIAEQARMYAEDPDDPKGSAETLKAYTRPAPNIYQWVFTDFEPTPRADGRSRYDLRFPFFIPSGESEAVLPWMPVADVKASSELKLDGYEYLAAAAVDGNPSTAWAEGAKGSGVGQTLKVTFPVSRHLGEIRVLPGYAKTSELFRKYNRPKSLGLEFSDGTKTSLSLVDENALQRFPVTVDTEWVKITIEDVYRGTTRDETYLSEIEFGSPAPAMLPFDTVLAGGMAASSGEVTTVPLPPPDGSGGARNPNAFPEWLRDPGWPLFAGCVGCGMLLGLIVGGVMVLIAWKSGRFAKKPEAPVEPPPL